MKKKQREYQEKYGQVPNDFSERFEFIIKHLKLSMKDIEKVRKGIKKLLKVQWTDLDFIFYFVPEATPRARYSSFTRRFYVKNASDNHELFKDFIEHSGDLFHIVTTPCKFYCDIYLPISNQMNRVEKVLAELKLIRAVSKPDWDNAGKTYSDMIQKHLLLDDSLIVEGVVRKFYSFKPRIEIRLSYMEKYDCKFNKKKIEEWKFYKDISEKIIEKDSIM